MGIFRKREGFVTKRESSDSEWRYTGSSADYNQRSGSLFNQILEALNGYPADDAALIVVSLRNLADGIQKQNPASKVLIDYINKNFKKPEISIDEKVEKTKKDSERRENPWQRLVV